MTTRTATASTMIRFGHPETDSRISGVVVDPAGRVATVHGDEVVRQSLLMLLSTRPGERVMRPRYGCPLHRLVFQSLDATTAGLAIHYVERAVRRWEPRAEILDVDAEPSRLGGAQLVITLTYRVRSSQSVDTLAVEIDLESAP